jgi:hypothetical protein
VIQTVQPGRVPQVGACSGHDGLTSTASVVQGSATLVRRRSGDRRRRRRKRGRVLLSSRATCELARGHLCPQRQFVLFMRLRQSLPDENFSGRRGSRLAADFSTSRCARFRNEPENGRCETRPLLSKRQATSNKEGRRRRRPDFQREAVSSAVSPERFSGREFFKRGSHDPLLLRERCGFVSLAG